MAFVIDLENLQSMLRDFYKITKIRIVIFDKDFREIACYPNHHSTYCQILRSCDSARQKCALCDKEACTKSKNRKRTVIYRCYAGLAEAVTPIQYGDITMGYAMFGQVLQTDNYDRSWSELQPVLEQFSVDIIKLKEAYYKKKNISSDTITAAASILQACAGYLYLSKIISMKDDSIENQIDLYINTHLQEELSADILCTQFAISKSHLYEIAQKSYGCGIAEHIRLKRVEKAKGLLLKTDKQISEIASMCGIDDYNYFTKIFKRCAGMTPREYRKTQKE